MLLNDGLLMISDTRTNAGVDNFSSYKKMHVLADGPDRQIYACTAGSLSTSQSVLGMLAEGLAAEDDCEDIQHLASAPSMFRVAQMVGRAVQLSVRAIDQALSSTNISTSVSFLLGGRIGDAPPRLFLIYSAGNFIECKPDAPFFQIGETKYGKPILDRGIDIETPIDEAVKVGLLSFDAAMRSNLGVARPLDLIIMPSDPSRPVFAHRIEPDDEYFNHLSLSWSESLHEAMRMIPVPTFLSGFEAR